MRDSESFDAFYTSSVRRITGQVYAMIGSRAEAEDCVQEAYARAWQHALAERWNGTAWAIVPTPSLPSWAGSTLTGVSCVTSVDCWARGSAGIRSFLAHWNGSRWSMAR